MNNNDVILQVIHYCVTADDMQRQRYKYKTDFQTDIIIIHKDIKEYKRKIYFEGIRKRQVME